MYEISENSKGTSFSALKGRTEACTVPFPIGALCQESRLWQRSAGAPGSRQQWAAAVRSTIG
uniref:Uncharacterized protein n=1 Tax=Arundo donax TaxID=35708 RepID=A0A0A8ZTS4_ARUDO